MPLHNNSSNQRSPLSGLVPSIVFVNTQVQRRERSDLENSNPNTQEYPVNRIDQSRTTITTIPVSQPGDPQSRETHLFLSCFSKGVGMEPGNWFQQVESFGVRIRVDSDLSSRTDRVPVKSDYRLKDYHPMKIFLL